MSKEQKEESLKEEKLAVYGLKKVFGRKTAVAGIDFSMSKGEIVGFLGQNGAGKTTAFYMIAGFIKPTEGKIMLGDREISKLPMYKRAKMGISYLPQEASIFRGLNVADNIRSVLQLNEKNPDKVEQELDNLLKEFSIEHLRFSPSRALSGGERRRLEIARALAGHPTFILLDEPLAGIDPIAVNDIKELAPLLHLRLAALIFTPSQYSYWPLETFHPWKEYVPRKSAKE